MTTIRNRTNSPYDLICVSGPLILPANGEVSGEFTPEYLELLKASPVVEVSDNPANDDLARLRKEYTDLTGKKFYHGWSAADLQEKIDKALEA